MTCRNCYDGGDQNFTFAVIGSNPPDADIEKVEITVTGAGDILSPYVISGFLSPDLITEITDLVTKVSGGGSKVVQQGSGYGMFPVYAGNSANTSAAVSLLNTNIPSPTFDAGTTASVLHKVDGTYHEFVWDSAGTTWVDTDAPVDIFTSIPGFQLGTSYATDNDAIIDLNNLYLPNPNNPTKPEVVIANVSGTYTLFVFFDDGMTQSWFKMG